MKKRWIYSLAFLAIVSLVNFACRKSEMKDDPNEKQSIKKTAISKQELYIDVEDVYAALPPIIMHNLVDAKLYVGRAQWKYTDEGLLVRIPTSEGDNGYIYATKTMADPEKVNVYAVKYFPDASSTDGHFSGKEIWIDFQNWTSYGIGYLDNIAVSHMEPQILAQPDWEILTTMHGHYYTNANGMIALQEPGGTNSEGFQAGMKPTGDPLDCPGEGSWLGNLFNGIGNFFEGIGGWIGGLFDGNGNGGGSGGGNIGGGGWGPGGYGNSGPGTPPGGGGGNIGGGWNGPSGGGGPVQGGPNVGEVEYRVRVNGGGVDRSTVFNPNNVVNYVYSVLKLNRAQTDWLKLHLDEAEQLKNYWLLFNPNLTESQKRERAKKHLQMMMENPGYLDFVDHFDQNYPIGKSILELSDYTFTPGSATHPITNLTEYLKCFANTQGATYKVTLAVDQPVPNTRKTFKLLSNGSACDVGHTFLILEQNVNGVITKRSIGWYPDGSATPFNPVAPRVLNNDAGHAYDVALVNNISGVYFMDIINAIKTDPHTNYDLDNYNCTNWAYNKVFMHPMDNIDATSGYWPLGYGMNPGDMGQDIRPENMILYNYQSIITNGNAPANVGTCP